jgi:hypothetical protein
MIITRPMIITKKNGCIRIGHTVTIILDEVILSSLATRENVPLRGEMVYITNSTILSFRRSGVSDYKLNEKL